MVALGQSLAVPSFNHRMFWAACCAAFFGFLRVGDSTCPGVFKSLYHLSQDDISLHSAGRFDSISKGQNPTHSLGVALLFQYHLDPGSLLFRRKLTTWNFAARRLALCSFVTMVAL